MDRVNSLILHLPMCDSCEHRQKCENRPDDIQIIQMAVCDMVGEQNFISCDEELVQTYKEAMELDVL